jgi:secreted PhoX family phosphatase
MEIPVGQSLAVRWIDIDNVDSEGDDLRARGAALGAAVFARGEGMWYGNDEVYFACTNGGLGKRGQIFKYTPSPVEGEPGEDAYPGTLQLYLEPNNSHLLESADDVGVARSTSFEASHRRGRSTRSRGIAIRAAPNWRAPASPRITTRSSSIFRRRA